MSWRLKKKKLIKTASYIYEGYKFVPYISGRSSLFLDPSEAVSLSSSLDAQGEKMSWRLKKKLIKTASYIYAGYKICSLHFWSFVSCSWSFRGCVFVIKPRCTRRENELDTEKKLIKTASYIYASYKICSLHFWSFVSFSRSFRGFVFIIKPRCTRRENELETEKKKNW